LEKTHSKPYTRGDRAPSQRLLETQFAEWIFFEKLLDDVSTLSEIQVIGVSASDRYELPLVSLSFGSADPEAPVLALFAGVHGLERIGSQVVLALLQSFSEALLWDEILQETLKKIRIVFVPFVNPLGILNKTRANPSGVDLMRNSPVVAEGKPSFLIGGQHFSSQLPWYRGHNGIEPEAQAVIDHCKQKFFHSKAVVSLDFHSGFGVQDQIWFPYAKSVRPFTHLPELYALAESYEKTHPHHFYKIEPQALHYTTHGDLWDYIYDRFQKENSGVYLPLALEMGSWIWMKKNPLQAFSSLGVFNPVRPHRQKRVLRRHQSLFEFLIRAITSNKHWASLKEEQRNKNQFRALDRWYPSLLKTEVKT
jgi:hypothetical protein